MGLPDVGVGISLHVCTLACIVYSGEVHVLPLSVCFFLRDCVLHQLITVQPMSLTYAHAHALVYMHAIMYMYMCT